MVAKPVGAPRKAAPLVGLRERLPAVWHPLALPHATPTQSIALEMSHFLSALLTVLDRILHQASFALLAKPCSEARLIFLLGVSSWQPPTSYVMYSV